MKYEAERREGKPCHQYGCQNQDTDYAHGCGHADPKKALRCEDYTPLRKPGDWREKRGVTGQER